MKLNQFFKEFIDKQYGKPSGLIGWYIGEKMVRQHQPETFWTISLLNLQKEEKVLDLGCGAGFAIHQLLKQPTVNHVVGLDYSKSVLSNASIRNKKAINEGKAKLVQGDVKHIPFQGEQFTKVFSIHSVYFWEDISTAISEIYRVLRPNGTAILTLCDGKDGESWNGIKMLIEQQIFPSMEQNGFKKIELVRGPESRNYQTVAVKAEK